MATLKVNVGPAVAIALTANAAPAARHAEPAVSGGSGAGYAWSLSTNGSGGSISNAGVYQAGATGNSTDVIKVADSLGNVATVSVSVGAGITLTVPGTAPPHGQIPLAASGGSGSGYSFTISTNGSGGSINSSGTGYTAGAAAGVADVVMVTDSLGNTATATIMVGAGVTITPGTPSTPPMDGLAFAATGGSGAGYVWSLASNASGGSINPATGAYLAGATNNVIDTVSVADSLGNTATVNVSVGMGLAINPAATKVPPHGTLAFGGVGGSGAGLTWFFTSSPSGGSINAMTGAYTAGPVGNVTDVVKVIDSLNNVATAMVQVGPGLSVTPPNGSTPPGGALALAVAGGSGTGYAWTISNNASNGTVNPTTGAYKAGATGGGNDTVTVTDSLGNVASVIIGVTAGVTATPPAPTVAPRGQLTLSQSGGSGTGYSWTMRTGASGGTVSSSGTYTAGATPNVVDVAQVTDSLGNTASVNIMVGPGVTISPATLVIGPNGPRASTRPAAAAPATSGRSPRTARAGASTRPTASTSRAPRSSSSTSSTSSTRSATPRKSASASAAASRSTRRRRVFRLTARSCSPPRAATATTPGRSRRTPRAA